MTCKGNCTKLNEFAPNGERMMRGADGRTHPQCGPCMNCGLPCPEPWELVQIKIDELRRELHRAGVNTPPPKGGGFGVTDSSPVPGKARAEQPRLKRA
jgi:hypothetical protein